VSVKLAEYCQQFSKSLAWESTIIGRTVKHWYKVSLWITQVSNKRSSCLLAIFLPSSVLVLVVLVAGSTEECTVVYIPLYSTSESDLFGLQILPPCRWPSCIVLENILLHVYVFS
jgi:hypothetical protein